MAKRRAGLHKAIASIFDGVPIPKSNGTPQPPLAPKPKRMGHERHSTANKWRLETTVTKGQKPSAAVASAPAPKREQPMQAPPKAAPTQQVKAATTRRRAEENVLQKIWQQIESKLLAPKSGGNTAKQKAMMILMPVLFIVLIIVLVKVFGTTPRKTIGAPKRTGASIAGAGTKNLIDWEIPEPYPTTLRDPMQLGLRTTSQIETEKIVVTGILRSDDDPSASSASIGKEIVHEGEKIFGATVVKINKDSVEFEMNGKRWTQKVQQR